MRRAVGALVLFVALAAAPQERPNFAGEWIATSTVGVPGFSIEAGGDGRMTIAQDATTLTVAWVSLSRNHKPVQAVVNLDGSERRYIDRNSVEPQERSTRSRWQGTQLVITTRWAGPQSPGSPDSTPVETEETVSLESSSTLKVAVTRRAGDEVRTGTRVFRRQ